MRWPWVDLLYLHGHITDPRLLRKPTAFPSTTPRPKPTLNNAHTPEREPVTSLRLCLGIGDGFVRSQ